MTKEEIFAKLQTEVTIRGLSPGTYYTYKRAIDLFLKAKIIVGIEPAGHYWFTLGRYLREQGIKLVMVNPYAVKQTKELDDNDPSKNDGKDPKVIFNLECSVAIQCFYFNVIPICYSIRHTHQPFIPPLI